MCFSSHEEVDLPVLTSAVTVLTDSEGTTVNPHELPTNEKHADITCSSCHKMHNSISDIPKKAKATCATCHHKDVYECGTCH
jgi:Zn finger protein HypA/HybF involved in hydrogenase expression